MAFANFRHPLIELVFEAVRHSGYNKNNRFSWTGNHYTAEEEDNGMIGLLKLVLLLVLIYGLYRGIQFFYKLRGSVQSIVGKDVCPACQQRIMVRDDEKMTCPRCGVKLARNQNGELLIRIN